MGADRSGDNSGLGMMIKAMGMRVTWGGGGGYFPEGKEKDCREEAEGGDELMNNHHMVP